MPVSGGGSWNMIAELRRLNEAASVQAIEAALRSAGVPSSKLSPAVEEVQLALAWQKERRLLVEEQPRRLAPKELKETVESIRTGLVSVMEGLDALETAQTSSSPHDTARSLFVGQVRSAVLRAIRDDVLARLEGRTAHLDIGDTGAGSSTWRGLFEHAQEVCGSILFAVNSEDLRAPTRSIDDCFARFIADLAAAYEEATGKAARSSRPGGNVAHGWRGPFARLVAGVWLLADAEKPSPSNERIAAALKARARVLGTQK